MEKILKKIIAFTYPHEAQMAITYLESYEIEATLKDEMTVQVYGFLSNAIGGVKLYVAEDRAEEALQLLKEGVFIQDEGSELLSIEKFDNAFEDKCPYCTSENVGAKRAAGLPFLVSLLLLGFPFLFYTKEYFCFDCSRKWKIK